MPPGVLDPGVTTAAFFSGRAGMILLSTGALGFVRENMKSPFRVAYVPRNVMNAAPVGGASLIIPVGQHAGAAGSGLDPDQLADQPRDRRALEPLHRLFRAQQGGL